MLIYSALSDTKGISLENGVFKISVTENPLVKSLEETKNKQILGKFFNENNTTFKIEIIEDETEQLIEKLKMVVGNKLKIKED